MATSTQLQVFNIQHIIESLFAKAQLAMDKFDITIKDIVEDISSNDHVYLIISFLY